MKQSPVEVKIPFLVICFVIAVNFTSYTCKSLKTSSNDEDELPWQEPKWKQIGTEDVKLQWKFSLGDKVQYKERQKTTITSEGRTTEQEHSITLQYYIKEVSKDGTAQVNLSWKNLDTKGTDSDLSAFLHRSSPNLGSFSISSSGQMTNISGLIGMRSLPTFPDDSLKIGSKWIDDVGALITPILPRVIMTGKCTYQLVGLADVKGYKWAKITFKGDLELQKQEAAQKVIGVKWEEKPDQDVQGVIVGEVVADSPAEKAGIFPGDIILSFESMAVNTWLDLIYAVAMSSHERSSAVIILRDNVKKELFVKPRVVSSGQIELKGSIKGMFVFDITMGGIVRMQISPFSRHALIQVGDKTTEREVNVEKVMQLVEYSTQMRRNNSRTK
ncbi:MAG: PDZ domain-containing protein [Thermodesulfobacteriota bacterium]|nr:PDZ domain-containing protein [Thermodesulfobacteriota bacterium]